MNVGPGCVIQVGLRASVQFAGDRGFTARVIRADPRPATYGWVWLDVYVLDSAGNATERRSIFVQYAGLRLVRPAPQDQPPARAGTPKPRNRGPALRVPRARTGSPR
jgi:hypothetical protein